VIEESVADYLLTDPPKLRVPIERLPAGTSTADLLEQVASRSSTTRWSSRRATRSRARFFPSSTWPSTWASPSITRGSSRTVDKKRILDAAGPSSSGMRKDGTLKRLVDRYYGHALRITAVDSGASSSDRQRSCRS
jgi:hypothetical protein